MIDDKSKGFTFTGIGTSWCILVDGELLRDDIRKRVLEYIQVFNKRFSRFLNDSEATAYRNAKAGQYPITEEFATLLSRADQIRRLTKGLCDPAVGGLLELAGYDATYSMIPQSGTAEFILPKWRLTGHTLTIDGPIVFDLGGMGKGYCIDKVAKILESHGCQHYLVDGGGDMYATTKQSGGGWRIALEYPGRSDMAAGLVDLRNQGLAVSDSFRRRWKGWHHIVHPLLKAPMEKVAGVVALAPNAWAADSATSALFFSSEDRYPTVAKVFESSYLVFRGDGMTRVSPDWEGELFA